MLRLFDLSLYLNGYDIKRSKRTLHSIQNYSSEQKIEYILKKRNAIVHHHLRNNVFYRNEILDSYEGNWDAIPVMTKRDLQQPLKSRLSKGYHSNNIYINKTSGSSGDPFTFAKDKWCHAMTWAQIMQRFGWYDIDFNRSYQARFYGIPLDQLGNKKERLKDFFARRYRFSVFDLSHSAFKKCLLKFKRIPFQYINGYTSAIVQFAKFLQEKGVCLKEICPTLSVCIVTSEILFADDRKLMKDVFGVPIVNEYGASELDLIGFEDPKGNIQLNSDTLYVEILDESDKVLPYGTEGRIVITSLYNCAHPFIRYDIGDIGIMDESSSIHKPILKTLVGRTNDLVKLPSGKTAVGLTFYYVTKSVIEESGNVKEFIIEQSNLTDFKITYVSTLDIDRQLIEKVQKAIHTYLETGLKISFNRVKELQRSPSGKLKQFISRV